MFVAVTDPQLLSMLVAALLGGGAAPATSSGSSRPGTPDQQQQQQGFTSAAPATAPGAAAAAATSVGWQQIPPALLVRLQYSPAAYRQALLGMLRGTDAHLAAAAVRVLASLLQSRAVSEEQLELIGAFDAAALLLLLLLRM